MGLSVSGGSGIEHVAFPVAVHAVMHNLLANGRQVWQGQRQLMLMLMIEKEFMSRTLFTRSCCCGDACEETVMHVKSHDQVFNALEPFPYSLSFLLSFISFCNPCMITVSS